MLPSLTEWRAFTGDVMLARSSITSTTRLPLAALIVSDTKIMESIISEERMVIT